MPIFCKGTTSTFGFLRAKVIVRASDYSGADGFSFVVASYNEVRAY
jgi:hypothetical protein